jgi:hypothetical protein
VDIKNIESKFWELKGKFVSGVIDRAEFDAELKKLKVRDENGDWWRLSEEKGKWTYFDGDSWVEGNAPNLKTAVEAGSNLRNQAVFESPNSGSEVFEPESKFSEPKARRTQDIGQVEKTQVKKFEDNHLRDAYEANDALESPEPIEVQYNFLEPVDEDYDFGIEADHLHGSMKELESVRLPDGFEEALASGKPRKYVKLSEVTKKENVKKSWKHYFADKKEVDIKDDDLAIEPSAQTASSEEIIPKVTGTPPEIPVSKGVLGLGGPATSGLAASKLKSVGKQAVHSAVGKATEKSGEQFAEKADKRSLKKLGKKDGPVLKKVKKSKETKKSKEAKKSNEVNRDNAPKKTKNFGKFKVPKKANEASGPADLNQQTQGHTANGQTESAQDVHTCQTCNAILKPGMKFCTNCGAKVGPVKPPAGVCSVCGHQNKPDSKFCIQCGNKMNS